MTFIKSKQGLQLLAAVIMILLFVVGCAVQQQEQEMKQEKDGVAEQAAHQNKPDKPKPVPQISQLSLSPIVNPPDENGLVTIEVVIRPGTLDHVITDIGHEKVPAKDGKVVMKMTQGDHWINGANKNAKYAVSQNKRNFPLYVNNVELTKIWKERDGGVLYYFIDDDGRIYPTNPYMPE